MKAATLVLVIGLSVAGVGIAFPDSPPLQTLQEIMQMKLGHAQGVLEAIVLDDFEGVETHAQQLLRLSETTTWNVLRTPEYRRYSGGFRDAASNLIEEARARNLDGAALAYVELTLKCVQCHKELRGARMAAREGTRRLRTEED